MGRKKQEKEILILQKDEGGPEKIDHKEKHTVRFLARMVEAPVLPDALGTMNITNIPVIPGQTISHSRSRGASRSGAISGLWIWASIQGRAFRMAAGQ